MTDTDRQDITVIIPARNAAATVDTTLRSLGSDRDLIGEIILVDDRSDDQTSAVSIEAAQRYQLPLQIVAVDLGSAGAARNAGMARASGRFLFFLDADDEVVAGGLRLLRDALLRNPEAGLSVGASIRRTEGREDKLKVPHGYTSDRAMNVRRYLFNDLWPIAMGSALVVASATAAIRFPEAIGFDEDTCYWAALLTRARVAMIPATVFVYHYGEQRMARRFVRKPRASFLSIALELNKLAGFGIPRELLQWRKAWIAQRIARQLIKHKRYRDAGRMMRAVSAHKTLGRSWKALQYRFRIRGGAMLEKPDRPASAGKDRQRRTLIVSYDPAYPPVSGADLRNYSNADTAAGYGPVRLASIRPLVHASNQSGDCVNAVGLTIEGERRTASLGWRRIDGEMRIPRSAFVRLRTLVQAFKPDTIIVEGIGLFKLLRHLRPMANQLILDMHNVESALAAQIQYADRVRPSLAGMLAASGLARLERKALGIVDKVWVCSNQDRNRLSGLSRHKVPIDIVPNGIPHAADIPKTLPAEAQTDSGFPTILFVGHLGYPPNVDAAERLAASILPRIRQALPGARLVLAGRSPKQRVRALASLSGVQLVENPQSLAPLLSAAHITIIPLKTGGGTRIKILEAMAWGVPVIATPLAAEGLDLVENDEILLSASDEGLADMAIALCRDAERRTRLRMRAHETVWARFGPHAISAAVRAGLGLSHDGE
ncbi:glycosyltransferase [Mesorhizobium erdmanii]|uniref:glycosyltransferase n=1 Tax=Mesorhizobium erdmanii TaxID=1777866 RepID=UPI001FD772F8|nr:glycosyltransferase [Mesorhizobium erdmanii]